MARKPTKKETAAAKPKALREAPSDGAAGGPTLDAAIKEALRRGLKEQAGAEEGARKRLMREAPADQARPFWRRQVGGVLGHVRRREIYAFCQQLALLLECGMPLVKALNTLAHRIENATLARVVREIGAGVEAGSTFTDALRKHRRHFPFLLINMVSAGEQSGTLAATLYRIAEQGERLMAARYRALSALAYPAVVLAAAVVVVAFVLGFTMSKFAELFETYGTQVPRTMAFLLRLGALFRSGSFWLTLVVAIVAVVAAYRLACRSRVFRLLRDRFLVRCPGVRHFVKTALISRFARVFSTMLGSGVPLQETLDACRDTTSNEVLRLALERVKDEVSRGGRITPELERSDTFPALAYDLSAVGEEAGALERVYERMAEVYEEKLEADIALVSKLVQPLVVVLLALVVGFILVAFFQTYIQLWQSIQAAAGA